MSDNLGILTCDKFFDQSSYDDLYTFRPSNKSAVGCSPPVELAQLHVQHGVEAFIVAHRIGSQCMAQVEGFLNGAQGMKR